MQEDRYGDMLSMERPRSARSGRMSMESRAAQFAPFATLPGYDGVVDEVSRSLESRVVLDEQQESILERQLHLLAQAVKDCPTVQALYFCPCVTDGTAEDSGVYRTVQGRVTTVEADALVFEDGLRVPFGDLLCLDGELFGQGEGTDGSV